ncbi:hypothetical protein HDU96_003982, partial [Phlyctochytrium bullatum]
VFGRAPISSPGSVASGYSGLPETPPPGQIGLPNAPSPSSPSPSPLAPSRPNRPDSLHHQPSFSSLKSAASSSQSLYSPFFSGLEIPMTQQQGSQSPSSPPGIPFSAQYGAFGLGIGGELPGLNEVLGGLSSQQHQVLLQALLSSVSTTLTPSQQLQLQQVLALSAAGNGAGSPVPPGGVPPGIFGRRGTPHSVIGQRTVPTSNSPSSPKQSSPTDSVGANSEAEDDRQTQETPMIMVSDFGGAEPAYDDDVPNAAGSGHLAVPEEPEDDEDQDEQNPQQPAFPDPSLFSIPGSWNPLFDRRPSSVAMKRVDPVDEDGTLPVSLPQDAGFSLFENSIDFQNLGEKS